MKKWDKIIIAMLVVISFLPYLLIKLFFPGSYDTRYAYITVNGQFYKQIPLTGQLSHKEFVVKTQKGSNKIVVENERIGVIEADCRDKTCKEFGFISKPGEIIVCLPHELYIEVRGQEDNEVDVRTY